MSHLVVIAILAAVVVLPVDSAEASFPKVAADKQKFILFSGSPGKAQRACLDATEKALGVKSEVGCYLGINALTMAKFIRGFGQHSGGGVDSLFEVPDPGFTFVSVSFRF